VGLLVVGKELGLIDWVGSKLGTVESDGPEVGKEDNVGPNVGEEVGRSPHSEAAQAMQTSVSLCKILSLAGSDDLKPLIHLHRGRNALLSMLSEKAWLSPH
jgi:hypothetical protein